MLFRAMSFRAMSFRSHSFLPSRSAVRRCPRRPPIFPDRPIKLIVPFAPGGGTDVLARVIAQKLNEKWGQAIVVENQPGASGGIGTRAVVNATPDGYTLLMASTGALMAAASSLGGDGPFDVSKYLAPITVAAAPPYLLVVGPDVPAKSAADIIRISKEKAGKSDLWLVRCRRSLAFVRRVVRKRRWHQDAACPVQRHGTGRDRFARRTHRHDVRAWARRAILHHVGEAESDRLDR